MSLSVFSDGPLATGQNSSGIAPALLISQIENTAAFSLGLSVAPARIVEQARALLQAPEPAFTPEFYFELCMAAHWLTVATFVPTDVDIHIRYKLWKKETSKAVLRAMALTTLDAYHWDIRSLSRKWIMSRGGDQILHGHTGEWLGVMVAAIAAIRSSDPELALQMEEAVLTELRRELKIFDEFTSHREGLSRINASYIIAHNFGDCRRVIETWQLPESDSLYSGFLKIESSPTFAAISKLNELIAAPENHRFFALRKPKCLRKTADLLLPIGPLFDEWGAQLSRSKSLSAEEIAEVVENLVDGYERLGRSLGYARALAGIESQFPGGNKALLKLLPAKIGRKLMQGPLRVDCAVPRSRFEEQWARTGLKPLV